MYCIFHNKIDIYMHCWYKIFMHGLVAAQLIVFRITVEAAESK
jgi:hypothetical protein